MPVRVGVFCPEHGANLEHTLESTTNCHLLVELRRLRQAGRLAVVVQLNTAAPPSLDPPISFGVWMPTKPSDSSTCLKICTVQECDNNAHQITNSCDTNGF